MGLAMALGVLLVFSTLSLVNGIRLVYEDQPENGIAFWIVGIAGLFGTIPLFAVTILP